MKLSLALSKYAIAAGMMVLFHLLPTVSAFADVLITTQKTTFGHAVSATADAVTFRSGCDANGANEMTPWTGVLILKFDNNCRPHTAVPPTAPLQVCPQPLVRVFRVNVGNTAVYLKTLSFQEGSIRGMQYNNGGGVTIKMNRVTSIQPVDACPGNIKADLEGLPGVCVEPPQMAVNWNTQPILTNQILTRGMSIYIQSDAPLVETRKEEITAAFRTALSLWVTLLMKHRERLDSDLTEFVNKSVRQSASVTLFVPPQVVRISCEENAMIVINWYERHPKLFAPPVGAGVVVAWGQLEGRTILLNAGQLQFGYRADFANPLPDRTIALLTVFVHEIGHCLGLSDIHDDPTSVMNPQTIASGINKVIGPSDSDFDRLTQSLHRSVTNTKAGFFDIASCLGLILPKDSVWSTQRGRL